MHKKCSDANRCDAAPVAALTKSLQQDGFALHTRYAGLLQLSAAKGHHFSVAAPARAPQPACIALEGRPACVAAVGVDGSESRPIPKTTIFVKTSCEILIKKSLPKISERKTLVKISVILFFCNFEIF